MKTVCFDDLPPYPVRSFAYRNEQVRADEVPRVIVYNTTAKQFKLGKHALITILVNKRRTKCYVCNGNEMHLVKVTGLQSLSFWY
jgi:hypothetical protein